MKSPLEVARWLADRFDEDSLPYALGGALALAAWAGPRQTVDVDVATHPVHQEMGSRRRAIEVDGVPLWFLSPEDRALLKLIYGRPKDQVDLERLFAACGDLDVAYIQSWLERIVPPADARLATLADLAKRFSNR